MFGLILEIPATGEIYTEDEIDDLIEASDEGEQGNESDAPSDEGER